MFSGPLSTVGIGLLFLICLFLTRFGVRWCSCSHKCQKEIDNRGKRKPWRSVIYFSVRVKHKNKKYFQLRLSGWFRGTRIIVSNASQNEANTVLD